MNIKNRHKKYESKHHKKQNLGIHC